MKIGWSTSRVTGTPNSGPPYGRLPILFPYLQDHLSGCKWVITMVIVSVPHS